MKKVQGRVIFILLIVVFVMSVVELFTTHLITNIIIAGVACGMASFSIIKMIQEK